MHSGTSWRLGHRPALDGLRGIAILLVVAAHLGVERLQILGLAGVTVFFTLSGFLITALLLGEHDKTGRISMRGFYRRRAFRLVPAFLLMLAVVVPLELVIYGEAPYWWATVLEVGNWISATRGAGALGMLHHTWSLAIEEQFYIAWPVVLGLSGRTFGRRGVIAAAGVGMVGSLAAMLAASGPRWSFGTDTNAFALLAGCMLAAIMVDRRVRTAPRFVVAAAGVLVTAGVLAGGQVMWGAVPVATVLAIWSVTTRPAAWLAWAPLRGAGRISYGWYLWNYPVAMLALLGGFSMLVVPFVSLGVAVLSWRYVEAPILRRGSHRVEVGVGAGVGELGRVERSPRHVGSPSLENVSAAGPVAVQAQ